LGVWITRVYVIDVYFVAGFDWFLAEIADESVSPYPCNYLPTLFLIVRVVKNLFLFFALRIAITLQVASLLQLLLM